MATTVNIASTKNYNLRGSNNYSTLEIDSGDTYGYMGLYGTRRRMVFQFIPNLPAGAIITSAQLSFPLGKKSSPPADNFYIAFTNEDLNQFDGADTTAQLVSIIQNIESDSYTYKQIGSKKMNELTGSSFTETIDTSILGQILRSSSGTFYIVIGAVNTYTAEHYVRINAPATLSITYVQGTMHYYTEGAWKECLVHYYDGSKWIQVMPKYYNGSNWIQVR